MVTFATYGWESVSHLGLVLLQRVTVLRFRTVVLKTTGVLVVVMLVVWIFLSLYTYEDAVSK